MAIKSFQGSFQRLSCTRLKGDLGGTKLGYSRCLWHLRIGWSADASEEAFLRFRPRTSFSCLGQDLLKYGLLTTLDRFFLGSLLDCRCFFFLEIGLLTGSLLKYGLTFKDLPFALFLLSPALGPASLSSASFLTEVLLFFRILAVSTPSEAVCSLRSRESEEFTLVKDLRIASLRERLSTGSSIAKHDELHLLSHAHYVHALTAFGHPHAFWSFGSWHQPATFTMARNQEKAM